jgi:GDP-L-fucose synthase
LIAKAVNAKRSETPFVCRGSGKPVRQFCYAPDLAKVIVWALESYNEEEPLNIAGPEISIKELSQRIASLVGIESEVVYDLSYSDGPYKRTVSTEKLYTIWPEFQATEISTALESMIQNI